MSVKPFTLHHPNYPWGHTYRHKLLALVSGRESDEGVLALLGTSVGRVPQHRGTVEDVLLQRHATASTVSALHACLFAGDQVTAGWRRDAGPQEHGHQRGEHHL